MLRKSHNNIKEGIYVKLNEIIHQKLKSLRFFHYFIIPFQRASTWDLVFLRVGEKTSKRRTFASIIK